jgi:hypothetical protein
MNNHGVNMIQVRSSNIRAIGYDNDNQELYVEFLNNSHYIYEKVPMMVFERLKNAQSKGKYLNQNIKDRYMYKQIKS